MTQRDDVAHLVALDLVHGPERRAQADAPTVSVVLRLDPVLILPLANDAAERVAFESQQRDGVLGLDDQPVAAKTKALDLALAVIDLDDAPARIVAVVGLEPGRARDRDDLAFGVALVLARSPVEADLAGQLAALVVAEAVREPVLVSDRRELLLAQLCREK
jgi:hypothetical protein